MPKEWTLQPTCYYRKGRHVLVFYQMLKRGFFRLFPFYSRPSTAISVVQIQRVKHFLDSNGFCVRVNHHGTAATSMPHWPPGLAFPVPIRLWSAHNTPAPLPFYSLWTGVQEEGSLGNIKRNEHLQRSKYGRCWYTSQTMFHSPFWFLTFLFYCLVLFCFAFINTIFGYCSVKPELYYQLTEYCIPDLSFFYEVICTPLFVRLFNPSTGSLFLELYFSLICRVNGWGNQYRRKFKQRNLSSIEDKIL